ncbi:MAG: hypothetical protein A4E55_00112 [Pelotomaculum sp. PtaU1.Bin035]|nr:MAG: hypothetical protein A4E55_00112 [Pelotomaculum sp. PtaU1.Bin035]
MDWTFIFKVLAYTFLFLAVTALAVHVYIRVHGGNWGGMILKILITSYATMLVGGLITGLVSYVLISGSK